ncbi:MAG: helix-turn-helix domain-containing protein [Clostridiales bacterium]|nr:helix-turn-helix domain-containing protein [Clostridiales bacterium]
MKNLNDYKDMLTIKDLCALLEISRYTAYKFLRNNKIKYVEIGNKFLISKSSLSKFLGV